MFSSVSIYTSIYTQNCAKKEDKSKCQLNIIFLILIIPIEQRGWEILSLKLNWKNLLTHFSIVYCVMQSKLNISIAKWAICDTKHLYKSHNCYMLFTIIILYTLETPLCLVYVIITARLLGDFRARFSRISSWQSYCPIVRPVMKLIYATCKRHGLARGSRGLTLIVLG